MPTVLGPKHGLGPKGLCYLVAAPGAEHPLALHWGDTWVSLSV